MSQAYTSHGPTVVMPTWFCSRNWFLTVGSFDEGGKVRVHTKTFPVAFSVCFSSLCSWVHSRWCRVQHQMDATFKTPCSDSVPTLQTRSVAQTDLLLCPLTAGSHQLEEQLTNECSVQCRHVWVSAHYRSTYTASSVDTLENSNRWGDELYKLW